MFGFSHTDKSGLRKGKTGIRLLAAAGISLALFFVYIHIYTGVLGWELPKTGILKHRNASLLTRAEILNHRLKECGAELNVLELRDEDIYRSIFGLISIPKDVRGGGLNGGKNYEDLDKINRAGDASALRRRADITVKRAYVQSKSYDEIELMLSTADNMATSIPAISPIIPDKENYRISSGFGYRTHPVMGGRSLHKGIDFAMNPGNPVYATGDGVVESIHLGMRGYGRQVVINHGFGYKTRYAHMSNVTVSEGMKVRRGEQIGLTGNTGLSSGPHLHYEVIFRGKNVNPSHYFDRDINPEQYAGMLDRTNTSTGGFYIHPMHRKK